MQQQALQKEVRWLKTDAVVNYSHSPLNSRAAETWQIHMLSGPGQETVPAQHPQHAFSLQNTTHNEINGDRHFYPVLHYSKGEFSLIEPPPLCYRGLKAY